MSTPRASNSASTPLPAPATCAGYPGSYGHEEQDAKTWASWGIDYLKYDLVQRVARSTTNKDLQPIYQKMGDALAKQRTPHRLQPLRIRHGQCREVGTGCERKSLAHDRRHQRQLGEHVHHRIQPEPPRPLRSPGHWNDPDMLEVGNGHMTDEEYRTHMSLWSLLASPLLAGNDLRSMTPATKEILMNKEVIAIDQDPLGKQATQISVKGDIETWARPLEDGSVAVGVFNRGLATKRVSVRTSDLKLSGNATARDLWSHKAVLPQDGTFSGAVPTHGVLLLRVTPTK